MAGRSLIGACKLSISIEGESWVARIVELETNREVFQDYVPSNSTVLADWQNRLLEFFPANIQEVEHLF